MQWYLDATFMNQGHSFFAPDVGPGHQIRYQLLDQNGHEIEHGDFASLKAQWPRLLYHRYFMLADQSELPVNDKATRDYWQKRYLEAFARQLLREHPNAQTAVLRRYAHWPLPYSYLANSMRSLRDQVAQLAQQNRTEEANELSRLMIKEAISRGYSFFKEDFAREMQGRHIDDQGFEVLIEASQSRNNLEAEAQKQAINWKSIQVNTVSRPWGPAR